MTSPDRYFGKGGHPWDALKIWQGGLGIWGAIGLGGLTSYLLFTKRFADLSFLEFADAIAPGLLIAQAIGRWGNWFNGELFGRPSRLPWALEIPPQLRPEGFSMFSTFQPTFLYESLWCLIGAVLLLTWGGNLASWRGTIFWSYVAWYCFGRFFMELLRIDPAHRFLGQRINLWVAGILFLFATSQIFLKRRSKNG
jgi:prolipoprotein diacylglyceryl transferase